MARFDVYPAAEYGYLLDVQSDIIVVALDLLDASDWFLLRILDGSPVI